MFLSFYKNIALLICFFCSVNVVPLLASPTDIAVKFTQLSTKNGLSQNTVYSMTQDQQGFLWIATEDGLNRFDGEKFTHYRSSASNVHSIADNLIRNVFVDNSNTLWVGTQHGLSRYNAKLDNFDNYFANVQDSTSLLDNIIWDIYQDQQQRIFVSTSSGLHSYNTKENNFSRIRIRGFEDKLTEIKTIYQDDQQNYWIGSYDNGISIVNNMMSYVISLQGKNKWNLTIEASTLYDFAIIDGRYWLATNNGVYVISKNYQLLKHYHQGDPDDPILSNEVRAIVILDETQVWFGTNMGLNSVNLLNDEIHSYQRGQHERALSENWILDLYRDDADVIWVATYGGGINKYHPISAKFNHRQHTLFQQKQAVVSFTQSADNTVWYATEDGELFQLLPDQSISRFPVILDDSISQLLSAEDDALLLRLTNGKLFYLNPVTNQLTEHKSWLSLAKHEENQRIFTLGSQLWYIDADGNLTAYHTLKQRFTRFPVGKDIALSSLYIENQQRIWATSSNNELVYFNPVDKAFNKQTLPIEKNFSIKQSSSIRVSDRWIWLGSDSQGVALLDRKSHALKVFNEEDQLLNNYVINIMLDEKNNAWLATNKGISVINPTTAKVQNFDGNLMASESEFISFSALNASSNMFYLGSNNGFYQFDPVELLGITQKVHLPLLTHVFVANKKLKIRSKPVSAVADHVGNALTNDNLVLSQQLNYIQTLKLNYNQSPVSLEFVSPNAKIPGQLRYRYRLTGLETDWITADPKIQRATYTNLSPGDYQFELEVSDRHDASLLKIKTLPLQIIPPWWLTNLAMAIYAFAVFALIGFIFRQFRLRHHFNLKIKLSEERLKLSLWGSGDEMWDWNIATGKIFRSNIWGILDFPQDGKRNKISKKTNIHPLDSAKVTEALSAHFANSDEHFEATYRVKDKSGNWVWILDRGKIVERDEHNQATRMTGTLKNISHIKESEERLRLFARCIESISDAVVIYDRSFIVVDVNNAYQKITGVNTEQVIGTPLQFAQYPDKFTANVKAQLIAKGSWHDEIQSCRANGNPYSAELNIDVVVDENKHVSHYVGVFSDITQRKETEAELITLANADTLTGLPNRSYFQANQAQLVQKQTSHALLVFDLDNFKKINDSMGHQVGDTLLCKVAERLTKLKSHSNTIYRLGGDEFSIILENIHDVHAITDTANIILQEIAQPMHLKGQEVVLFASVGIALYPDDGITPHELLKNADTAMYHAKNLGGNMCQFFSDSMNKQAVTRLQIENLLRLGLKNDLFTVFYQPKIEIATGKVSGMEALVRFETPSKGLISPEIFIPVSEQTGQIIDIGEIVLRKACMATKKWVDAGLFDGRIAVNLSAVQFSQPNLVVMIADILQQSQLPAKYLELEITEGTVMNEPQQAIETMLQIRAMGIHLALDDFGTGYSSLAYLKKFPLNTLKIDKAFVDDIEHSEQGRNMVATIVTIAHNLDMKVVAEGVETSRQMDFLADLNCEQLQGYLYSKPLSTRNFEKYLLAFQIANKSTLFENH